MNLDFAPISLTDILTMVISVTSSLLLAFLTSKREMKKRVFEERLKIYRSLFSFLRNLKKNPIVRSEASTLQELSKLEVDIKMLGTEELISIIQALKERLEITASCYERACTERTIQFNNELDYLISERGLDPIAAKEQLEREWNQESARDDHSSLLMHDEVIDVFCGEAVKEMRRSLTQTKRSLAVSLRKKAIEKKLNSAVDS